MKALQSVPAAPELLAFPFDFPVNPGPSFNVPRVAAPQCLGMLPQFETEWWYYAGRAESAGEQFSVQLTIVRTALNGLDMQWQGAVGTAGIGTASNDAYLWSIGYALGASTDPAAPAPLTAAPVGDRCYDISFRPMVGDTRVRVVYTGGESVGMIGSTYRLQATGSDGAGNTFTADFALTDQRGLVLEGASGYVGPGMPGGGPVSKGAATYEYAQAKLEITGGSIVIGGASHELTGGNLWLDRQVKTNPPSAESAPALPDPARLDAALAKTAELYCGDWMSIKLDGGPTVVVATFWQPAKAGALQWITGTLVNLPPTAGFGTVYLPADVDGSNGGTWLRGSQGASPSFDFDINILRPHDPASSPHWQSPQTSITYSNGWWVRFAPFLSELGVPQNLYIRALVSGCENRMPGDDNYWEGSADVYADEALQHRIGTAFVEQMGFN
jgi:hypothetical protein